MLVLGIARVAGAVDAAGFLLAGVAVAAILGALRSFLMLALSDETVSLQVVMSWVLGGIQTLGHTSEVKAPADGEIREVLVTTGAPVEYGQALFVIALR